MSILIKCFLTYAATSMLSGFLYAFVYGMMLGNIATFSIGLFIFLWIGPLAITISIGVPIGLWKFWKDGFK